MEPREQELVAELKEANTTLQYARSALAEAKRKYVDAETNVINAKLKVERLNEALRVIRVQQVVPDEKYDLYDDEG
jgi:predicted  nucleic acid-binding Zn-ribbon protein